MAPAAVGTATSSITSQLRDDDGIKSLRYEETMEGKPPISVTVPPPRAPPTEPHPALRDPSSLSADQDPEKRDSALASTTSTAATSTAQKVSNHIATNKAVENDLLSPTSTTTSSTAPTHVVKSEEDGPSSRSSARRSQKSEIPKSPESHSSKGLLRLGIRKKKSPTSSSTTAETFSPIDTQIPTPSLIDMEFLQEMSFSKRGSMLFGGKNVASSASAQRRPQPSSRQPSTSMLAVTNPKVLTSEIEEESQKVRSMYESADATSMDWRDGRISVLGEVENIMEEAVTEGTPNSKEHVFNPTSALTLSSNRGSALKREHELAGGLEDWEDVQGGDVDRYGFISMREVNDSRPGSPEPRPPHRVSTVLQIASDTPRPQRRILGRAPSSAKSARSIPRRTASRKVSGRSLKTIRSDASSNRKTLQPLRVAVNHLPGNKDRRWMDEAGDMLTLPPGLADIAENEEDGKAAEALKMKEWARAEKWRKMAKVVKNGKEGEGMDFEFDVNNSKLIERTWKGIPDRWRATAWFSFLGASAKKQPDSATDDDIIDTFRRLLDQSSEDDVQIDIDVPRTINSHIMFRRRYRGGQRLLFRVLHCLSLYFPDTGYVQGMASLAATLLCYYDEEKTFIMLVRMWQLRGLEKLYANGFGGLMSALDEFHTNWLAGSEVSKQLKKLCIEPTAYCTRWYLTLFNYSIPFPAQLRVWDVFMLLGDEDPTNITTDYPFGGGLDVIHAAGAALLEGTREILLDSDFENAMKVLTSWIPVKDEEMLLNITKVKWKQHHGKRLKPKPLISNKSTAITKSSAS